MRQCQIHLVSPAAQGFGITLDLAVPAGIDVVYAGVDATADDFGTLLLIAAGMPAQTNRRKHQVRATLPTILHVRVVVQNLGRVDFFGLDWYDTAHGYSGTGRKGGTVAYELAACLCTIVHYVSPFLLTGCRLCIELFGILEIHHRLFRQWFVALALLDGLNLVDCQGSIVDSHIVEQALVAAADANVKFIPGFDGQKTK